MQYDAIIFDLDGTLWDASQASANGWNKALQTLGLGVEINAADIRSIAGLPLEDCVRTLVPQLKASKFDKLLPVLNLEEEKALRQTGGELYPQVEKYLRSMAQQTSLMIVSNCQQWYLEYFLELMGLQQHFKDTDCYGNTGTPKSETLKGIVARNGLENPIYIGDTAWDFSAAKKAKMPFIHAAYGFGEIEDAPSSVASFSELESLLLVNGLKKP
ncbi:MAG: HAD family hydrolase [Halobacteriovoraceae bacterium]|jgi:phosphoglycolate phosphatase|nr:HAD family hydrolase [Halobacteriovoraceae bacterium]MBT5095807.1 HAD family hydrolase [Halobacteriovoraceae bacterium]